MKILKSCDFTHSNNFSLFLSSADINFIRNIQTIYNNTVLYKKDFGIYHSSKFKNSNDNTKYEKIIGDIILISKSNRYILSYYSTFSLLMFYTGGLDEKKNVKQTIFINEKGEIINKDDLQYLNLVNEKYNNNKRSRKKCKKYLLL